MTESRPAQLSDGPGSSAARPTAIPARGYFQIFNRVAKRFAKSRISLIAAGCAFFGLLALFPALAALVAIGGLILNPETLSAQITPLLSTLPDAAADILQGQLTDLAGTETSALGSALLVSMGLAIYSASRGTMNLISGLNTAYEEDEARGFFKLQAVGISLTFALTLGLAMTFLIAGALPVALATLHDSDTLATVAQWLRWPILLAAAIGAFGILYRFGPSRRPAKWRWVTPGATLGVVLWLAGTAAFSWYVQTFGTYNQTFGALAGVIVLMLWLYVSSLSVLTGALVDAEIEAQTACDSTVGEDRPIGQRGAVKADTVAAD